METTVQVYRIPGIDEYNKILDILKHDFTITEEKDEENYISIYDTFDWRLYHSNLNLILSGDSLTLWEQNNQAFVLTETMKKHTKVIRKLKRGPIFNRIKSIIKTRALIQFAFTKENRKKTNLSNNQAQKFFFQMEFHEITQADKMIHPTKKNTFLFIKHPGQDSDICRSIYEKIKKDLKYKLTNKDFFTHM